jgi:hypothetical protein
MIDNLPTARLAVYIFLEFIALGFALEAVTSFMHGENWWKWAGALLLGVVFMLLGVKSESIIKRSERYLNSRLLWMLACGVVILYSLYFLQRWLPDFAMSLHQRLPGTVGYATVSLVGATLACGCWWLTGKMLPPAPIPTASTTSSSSDYSSSTSSISLDDDSQYELFKLSPKQKAGLDKAKAPLFKYKAALLDTPEYRKEQILRDKYRKLVEDYEKQAGHLIDLDKVEYLPKPPATIAENAVDIDISVKMVADELSKTFFWMIRNNRKVRVPIAMFISLTTRQTTPLKIDLLYLDAKSIDGWADIRMADSWFPNHVRTMKETPLVLQAKNACSSMKGEYLLPSLYERIIQPNDKVEGWIIAEYPKGLKYGNSIGDMRISLLAGNYWIASKTFPANPRVYREDHPPFDWYLTPLDTLITEDW